MTARPEALAEPRTVEEQLSQVKPVSTTWVLSALHRLEQFAENSGVRLSVTEDPGGGSVVVVDEDERRLTLPLPLLCVILERHWRPRTPSEAATATRLWFDQRPATDAAAAAHGVAVLTANPAGTLFRQVVIPRSNQIVPWVPSITMNPKATKKVRTAALKRASQVEVQPFACGDLTVWICTAQPSLSTSPLLDPAFLTQLTNTVAESGEPCTVVVAPGRPFVAGPTTASQRMLDEVADPYLVLNPADMPPMRWR